MGFLIDKFKVINLSLWHKKHIIVNKRSKKDKKKKMQTYKSTQIKKER